MLAKVRSLEIEIATLKAEIEELNLLLREMYFYGADLVERVRTEPIEARVLSVESQTSDKGHADGLRLMKGEE